MSVGGNFLLHSLADIVKTAVAGNALEKIILGLVVFKKLPHKLAKVFRVGKIFYPLNVFLAVLRLNLPQNIVSRFVMQIEGVAVDVGSVGDSLYGHFFVRQLADQFLKSFSYRILGSRNSIDYREIIERTKKNFAAGGTIAVFPEGTRSLPTGQNRFKKGAARLSLATGCPILPVHIGGNDKYGLRKGEYPWQINPDGAYEYVFTVKDLLYPDEFEGLPEPIAAKRYTAKLRAVLADESNASWPPHPQTQA